MYRNPAHGRTERARILATGLLALGAAGLASLFAPVESREAAPVLGVLWLFDLAVGTLFLLLWAAWDRLEPRRRRAATKWEARLARRKLEHYRGIGTLCGEEAARLAAAIERRERAALRRAV